MASLVVSAALRSRSLRGLPSLNLLRVCICLGLLLGGNVSIGFAQSGASPEVAAPGGAAPGLAQATGTSAAPATLSLPPMKGPSATGIYEATLANGLRVLIKEVHTSPLFCASVWYRAGSRNEGPGTTGLAHLLEHMMFKGTARYGKGQFDQILERNGALNNASTSLDRTQYYILVSKDRADLAMELEADRMRGALFTQTDLDDEMTVVRNELEKGEDNPYDELAERTQAVAILEHPYHWPVIGWKTDVEAITAAQIHQYYDRNYQPNNAFLVLLGDLSAAEMLDMAVRHFSPVPRGADPEPVVTVEPEQKGERRFLLREAGRLRILNLAYHTPARKHPDTLPLDVTAQLLAGGRSSRLYKALVETGLATDVAASNGSDTVDPYLLYIYVDIAEGASPDSVEAALDAELERLTREAPAEAEVRRAAQQLKVSSLFARDDLQSLMFAIGEAEISGGYGLFEGYLDSLAAVTPGAVRRVASTYLKQDNRTVGLYLPIGSEGGSWTRAENVGGAGPVGGGAPVGGAAPGRERAERSTDRDASRLPEARNTLRYRTGSADGLGFAEAEDFAAAEELAAAGAGAAIAANATASVEATTGTPQRFVLSNGAVLLVQESRENPTVELRGFIDGGMLLEPKGKEGVASLTARSLPLGTSKHSAAELAELLESAGIRLSFAAGREAISVSGRSLAEGFPTLMDVFSEILTEPNFPPDQIEVARSQVRSDLDSDLEDTYQNAWRAAVQSLLGADSPYARFVGGSEAVLPTLTREDAAAFHREMLAGKRWTFAVVGDVDAEQTRRLFEEKLGSVPAGDPVTAPPLKLNASKAGAKPIKLEMEDKSQVDLVAVGQGIPPNDPGYDAAYVANVILGGSFTSRLNRQLRDNEGLTYGADSGFDPRRGVTLWTAGLGVNPENVDKALTGLRREMTSMRTISQEDLDKAKEYAAGSFPIRINTKGRVADTLLYAERFGLGLDYIQTFGKRIHSVELADVRKAAERFTDPSKVVVAIAGTM